MFYVTGPQITFFNFYRAANLERLRNTALGVRFKGVTIKLVF